jgi:2-oxoglutarate dehydrogenase E2 component (dihydrolipoamide succinyltransferase)
MKFEMLMPQMGESIAEATILKWLRNVGEKVEKDQTILEISTDKVDSEIPAPATGVISEIRAKQGDTVPVKAVIAIIDTEGAAGATAHATNGINGSAHVTTASATPPPTPPPSQPAPELPPEPARSFSSAPSPRMEGDDRFYSPLVKNLAAQYGVSDNELSLIQGTGSNGRVTKQDILDYIDTRGENAGRSGGRSVDAEFTAKRRDPVVTTASTTAERLPAVFEGEGNITIEPFDRMRKLIAEHMVRSKATSPHVYSTAEVDVTNIAKWRTANQDKFQKQEGFKLSFTPFFLEAVVKGLKEYPKINASVENDNLIIKKNVNLGCAVALGKDGTEGLIVPVIKNAHQLNFAGLASALNTFAQKARAKKLAPDDIQGGTFTVTNPGIFGNIIGNPIINQPQLAILSIGAIKKRVMVVNDAIAIRDMVYLTLSYDHRVIDGSLGGLFLSFITKYLEGWDLDREV